MKKRKAKEFSDFTNVKNIHDDLIPEEFPEGSFGSPINATEVVSGKSSPWEAGQRRQSAYVYPDKAIHKNLPRQAPGAHPPHNELDSEPKAQAPVQRRTNWKASDYGKGN